MTASKIINFVLAVMFLMFAFVQIDDPDPALWIAIYGTMAILSVLAMFAIYLRIPMLVLAVAFAAYATTLFNGVREWFRQPDKSVLFDDIAKMEHLYIEEAREFLGLFICIVVLAGYLLASTRQRRVA